MRFSSAICSMAVLSSTGVNGFAVFPNQNPQNRLILGSSSALFLSDDSPSDTSSDTTTTVVDVPSEPYDPTKAEALVTSVLDQLPTALSEVTSETRTAINEALLALEALNPTEQPAMSPLLNGVWELRYAAGYASDWALPSPTRQLALFLYSGGYSPGLFALSLAKQLPAALVEVGDLEIAISRDQPRVEAKVAVGLLNGSLENEVVVRARLEVESAVRLKETYESAVVLDRNVDLPEQVQYSRELYVVYLDDDLLVVRDASGVPEVLVRKEKAFREPSWGVEPDDVTSTGEGSTLPGTDY